ncbi:MAG TPA: DUF3854 domain-containing protein [Pyrinomonadaceae bacterium]|jgi:hypothetical protein|nr:DUF3854 domain-containing protein [Pyrinomonadaceae bacterium]
MGGQLSEKHLRMLREESGISEVAIAKRGYRTVTDEKELIPLGFSTVQRITPGLLIPSYAPDGSNGLYSYRPDAARVKVDKRRREADGSFKQHVIKYATPTGSSLRVDCPPSCFEQIKNPNVPLWITEGIKKADALASNGLCAVALFGVWGFKGKNDFGGVTFLADWDYIALKGRDVRIVYDSDVMQKPEVRKAQERLTAHLQRKGALVSAVYLPGGRENKVGVDDFLLTHSIEELESLVDAPRPRAKPAQPVIELLDYAPPVLGRPLALIGQHAYAAIWPHVKETKSETVDKSGNILKHDPPLVTYERRLCIVRSDGVIFGSGTYELSELGLDLHLAEIPPDERLWSSPGVKAFVNGRRPSPAEVYNKIADVVDRFIDFDRSLAAQRTMAEIVACFILATWFLSAFTVIGFIWPNGEKGSGKTQLLTLIAELGYLGQLILSGGSYASLHDLADYGATLCFDDAENLSDPKRTDPDKRTLLLAGNRKGNTVPVKEPIPGGGWRTRYVNTFCARAFSAIRLPDSILASRTVIVPLIRTPDRYRANADPLEYSLWPHDRRKLVDDLWMIALLHLAELPVYEARVNESATLTGRNLEPWRAILAVSLWLDDAGVTGLYRRMESLSVAYQKERQQLESGDTTALIIRALCKCLDCDVVTLCDPCDVDAEDDFDEKEFVRTADIEMSAKEIAESDELDIDPEKLGSRQIGRILSKLRFEKGSEGGTHKKGWKVSRYELSRFIRTLGLGHFQNVTSVTERHNVTTDVPDEDFVAG